ncbi:MAG: tRNA 2-thiouridine(34) synthase MnmA [Oscillospiraceae bacterium]|nr:tRNA 2-thiouridine(34) synthase MnmA [Oscillospiraceae bacterium]MCR5305554.1 tRNA 2-thiouridine(34) synthase MnmA [Oscillospiraceae bacterium]
MKALIAMSGGVDSSVAAYLTGAAGFTGIGCTMRLWDADGDDCAAEKDAEDARFAAERLGMEHHIFDFRADFREQVIGGFVRCYLCGRTPNPCIECNRHFKFARLLARADALGCEKIVTGHYARTEETDRGFVLRRGLDAAKDQSYVLYMLTQAQLSRLMLPLGGLTKAAVRQIAAEQGFLNAGKHDSQDICFVPDGDYARVVERVSGTQAVPGEFVDLSGNVLGQHRGIIHYTVGQRRGLGIALGAPAYVVGIDAEKNRVILGKNEDLFTNTALLSGMNWISGSLPQEPVRCTAKIRYRHTAQPAWLRFTGTDTAVLRFDAPQRAITAGQAAVCYDGDIVLGGGCIERAYNSDIMH